MNSIQTMGGNASTSHQVAGWNSRSEGDGDGWSNLVTLVINEEKETTYGWMVISFIVDHMLGGPNWHEI